MNTVWSDCNNCGAVCKRAAVWSRLAASSTGPQEVLLTEMSETSSDAESSCGWTIINNEGSDIETLGSEAVVEEGAEMFEHPTVEEPNLQESPTSTSAALCVEEKAAGSLDDTLIEQTEPYSLEENVGKQHVLSSSDHSDIVTLGELKEGEHTEEEEEERYLGMSCSSHYTFTSSETGVLLSPWKLPQTLMNLSYRLRGQLSGSRSPPVFPAQQPAATNSSSSEDETRRSSTPVVRRRRVRRNTASVVTDQEEEVLPDSCSSEAKEEEEEQQEEDQTERTTAEPPDDGGEGRGGGVLNKCILLALIVAFSMGFGHFYGTVQVQERQKTGEKFKVNEIGSVRDLLQLHLREQRSTNQLTQRINFNRDDLDEQQVILLLAEVIQKIKKENQELSAEQGHIQAQRDDLMMLLRQTAEERTDIMSQQQSLKDENLQLKTSLEQEEKSLSVLQKELRSLRSKIQDLEVVGAGADSLLSENQRLKERLEDEQQLMRDVHDQRDGVTAEARMLRKKLEKERKEAADLKRELDQLRSRVADGGAEDLQAHLMELQKRLSFEQQRSDLWERLYVETKQENAKGDQEPKVKKAKSMTGKVKETFDAVRNSTKEFVHHHKEQIKKAKEAVKENLRKFSDSVKSTFRHFKDSASTFINKAQSLYSKGRDKKSAESSWHHGAHKPHHRHKSDFSQSDRNTRKPGGKVHQGHRGPGVKGCTDVFDCAFQEFTSLFNTATEPVRADEFYLLLQSYLQQEVEHFSHWKELEAFLDDFFHNGVFIHDRMLFTDFLSGVEDYLTNMQEYHGLHDAFRDLDDYVYRHLFGETYTKTHGPRGPSQRPDPEPSRAKHHQRKQQRGRTRPHGDRKWSRSGRNADGHVADVKIELGPMPFDPKY